MALDKIGIAKRIAQELQDGTYVNLGIGIPTLVANYVPRSINVEFQSENGVLGMGPFPFEGEEDAEEDAVRHKERVGVRCRPLVFVTIQAGDGALAQHEQHHPPLVDEARDQASPDQGLPPSGHIDERK